MKLNNKHNFQEYVSKNTHIRVRVPQEYLLNPLRFYQIVILYILQIEGPGINISYLVSSV